MKVPSIKYSLFILCIITACICVVVYKININAPIIISLWPSVLLYKVAYTNSLNIESPTAAGIAIEKAILNAYAIFLFTSLLSLRTIDLAIDGKVVVPIDVMTTNGTLNNVLYIPSCPYNVSAILLSNPANINLEFTFTISTSPPKFCIPVLNVIGIEYIIIFLSIFFSLTFLTFVRLSISSSSLLYFLSKL